MGTPLTLQQYLKKPFHWKLGYLKLHKKKLLQQAGLEETEEGEHKESNGFLSEKTGEPHEEDVDSLHQITFTSPAVPSVLSAQDLIDFHTVQVERGEGESVESLKSAAVESYLDTVRSLNKVNKRVSFGGVEERQIRTESPEVTDEKNEDDRNLFENPLYESLNECLSGLVGYDQPLPLYVNGDGEHLYQNNEPVYQNEGLDHEHVYENEMFGELDSSTDDPIYENIDFHNESTSSKPNIPPKPEHLKNNTNPFHNYEEQSSISSTPSSLTPPQNPSPPPHNPFLTSETRQDPEGKEGDSPHYSPRTSLQMNTTGVEFEKSLLKLNPTSKPSAVTPREEEAQDQGDEDSLLAQGFKKTQIIEIFDDGSWDSKEVSEEMNAVEEVSVTAATNYSVSAATETNKVASTTAAVDGVFLASCVTITDNNQSTDMVSEASEPENSSPVTHSPPFSPPIKSDITFTATPAKVIEELTQKQREKALGKKKAKNGGKKEGKGDKKNTSQAKSKPNTQENVELKAEDIEKERKRLICEQVKRTKKMESWIKSEQKQPVLEHIDSKTLESIKKYEERKRMKEVEKKTVNAVLVKGVGEVLLKDGEVNFDSIIENKDATKSFWENKMLAAVTKPEEEVPKTNGYHHVEDTILPPPQFTTSDGNSSEDDDAGKELRKYIYGDRGELVTEKSVSRKEAVVVEAQKPASQENIIEQEIREQQMREAHMRKELMMKEEDGSLPSLSDDEQQESLNPQESVIEREIRLQREREKMLMEEREEAKRMAINKAGLSSVEPLSNGYTSPSPPPDSSSEFPSSAEARIALEIRELKVREEELRRARELGVDEPPVSFTASTTTDEGNYSECGQDDSGSSRLTSPEVPAVTSHQRTQSLDSISSGHSSSGTAHSYAEFVSKRKVTVRPLAEPEEEEETPAYRRVLGETAVEREIRVSMERDEELKKMRRSSVPATSTPVKKELSRRPSTGKLDTAPDSRDAPHRLATLSIRRELWEQSEREQMLRQEGTIRSISEDYVDAKVTRLTDLVEMSKEQINEQTMKMVGASPTTNGTSPTPVNGQQRPLTRKISAPVLMNGHSKAAAAPVVTPARVSTTIAPTRGLMQKFIANRGKIPAISAFNSVSSGSATLPPRVPPVNTVTSPTTNGTKSSSTLKPPQTKKFEKNKTSSRTQRRYSTAEERIHQELQDMKQREQELRNHRKQILAQSQPDLLAALADEEFQEQQEDIQLPSLKPLRDRAMSNPSLLDDDECDSSSSSSKPINRAPRRNPLIAKWESRIQQNSES